MLENHHNSVVTAPLVGPCQRGQSKPSAKTGKRQEGAAAPIIIGPVPKTSARFIDKGRQKTGRSGCADHHRSCTEDAGPSHRRSSSRRQKGAATPIIIGSVPRTPVRAIAATTEEDSKEQTVTSTSCSKLASPNRHRPRGFAALLKADADREKLALTTETNVVPELRALRELNQQKPTR